LFAGFLSDYDPSLVFIVTYETRRRTSYLKLLKIDAKKDVRDERRHTLKEDQDKKELIEKVRNNLITSGVGTQITKQLSQENTEVKIDTEKQRLRINKFGMQPIAIKASEEIQVLNKSTLQMATEGN